MSNSRLIVIGAGIIGLSSACEAARRHWKVTVFERDAVASGASPVAAGMLAPLKEAHQRDAFLELGLASLQRYREYAQQLEDMTGIPLFFHSSGILSVALTAEEGEMLRPIVQQIPGSEWLNPTQVHTLEPELPTNVEGGVLLPSESKIHTRNLMTALHHAALTLNVDIRPWEPVIRVRHDETRVLSVATGQKEYSADRYLLAAGAWSSQIQGLDFPWMPEIFPVRGQVLTLRTEPLPIRHIIHGSGVYLVPQSPGNLIVGATSEERVYRSDTTVEGITHLLSNLLRLIPRSGQYPLQSLRSGLRPATYDHWPVLGPTPLENLDLAIGHYRNGILLAPVTAMLLGDFWESGCVPEQMKPFTWNSTQRPRSNGSKGHDHPRA